jgi:hypothetical protein
MNMRQICQGSGIPYATVAGWLNYHVEPRHRAGEQMIMLWCRVTGQRRDGVPLLYCKRQ